MQAHESNHSTCGDFLTPVPFSTFGLAEHSLWCWVKLFSGCKGGDTHDLGRVPRLLACWLAVHGACCVRDTVPLVTEDAERQTLIGLPLAPFLTDEPPLLPG